MKNKTLLPFALPEAHFQKLFHRVAPILEYWGQHCRWIGLEVMAFSCYSQGVVDGVQLIKQRGLPQENDEDYSI